jgi:simple sugar transport system ATP-binding protein
LVLDRFQVRADSPNVRTENLSGGNQQRLVLGRELDGAPALIVAHNPTRGLDVRSSLEVWNGLVEARNRGAAVVAISPDLVELIEYSDRIVVIYQGRIVGQASPEESNIEWIGSLMVGGGDVAE